MADEDKIQQILASYLAGVLTESRQTAAIQELINAGVPNLKTAKELIARAVATPGKFAGAAGTIPLPDSDTQGVVEDILGDVTRGITSEGRGLEILRRQAELFGGGPFAPFIQQGLGQRFNPTDISSQFLLSQFGGGSGDLSQDPGLMAGSTGRRGQVPEGTFREFAGGLTGARPNPEVLAAQLRNILSELEIGEQDTTQFTESLQGEFEDPRIAFRAALQPALARISPSLRAGFLRRAGQRFANQLAADPSQFATPVQSFRQFAPRFGG